MLGWTFHALEKKNACYFRINTRSIRIGRSTVTFKNERIEVKRF